MDWYQSMTSNKIILTSMILTVVLFGVSTTQETFATSMTFTEDTTITEDQVIADGETWLVSGGVTLTINSGVTVTNEGIISNQFGTIKNSGTINNLNSVVNIGQIIKLCGGSFTGNPILGIIDIPCIIKVEVDIDIKPGSDPNCFNSDGHGVIPVAILGSETFDVMQIDTTEPISLDGQLTKIKGNGDPQVAFEDVNDDGYQDMVVKIIDDDEYELGEESATLTGKLLDGTDIEGTDSICITQ